MLVKALSLILAAVMAFSAPAQMTLKNAFGDALGSIVSVYDEGSFEGRLSALMEKYDGEIKPDGSHYQTRRLLVYSKSKSVKNTCGAVSVITDGSGYFVYQFDSEKKTKAAEKLLLNDNGISDVEVDSVVKAFGDIKVRNGASLINSDRYKSYLKENGKNSKIVVAVLDTGVDSEHDVFFRRCVKGFNAYKNNSRTGDLNGHGTHVAGIIADNTPDSVKIMPVKVLQASGGGTASAIKLGVEYAVKHGADVINMSFGGDCTNKNCPIKKAIRAAVEKGVTVIVAAGNEAADTKHTCPADMKENITVASTNEDGSEISAFSNYGASVDLAAPGENIESAYLGKTNAQLSGTSMAAPFASAAAALVLTNNPRLTPAQVKKTLKGYCADMYIKGNDRLSGAGVINLGIALGDNLKADSVLVGITDKTLEMYYFKNATWFLAGVKALSSEESTDRNGVITAPSITDRTFEATSSDPKVATFDGKYVVPKGKGTATITIKVSGGQTSSFTVKVKPIKVWTDYAAKKFAGGKGTRKNPYKIKTAAQLAKLAKDVRGGKRYKNKYFKLTRNINLKGKKWMSICRYRYDNSFFGEGIAADSFLGTFDGGNHKIKNMTVFNDELKQAWGDMFPVNAMWYENAGLFGTLERATVKNLGIENARVYSAASGILASDIMQNTTVKNCYTSGESEGSGFAYQVLNYKIKIKNCYSSASVKRGGMFYYIYSSGDEGGVKINNCFFCGRQKKGESKNYSGGFADTVESFSGYTTDITNCFSSCACESKTGFVRNYITSDIYRCYYSSDNKRGTDRKRGSGTLQLKKKSTAFFKRKGSYTKKSNWRSSSPWDFKNTWAINKKINGGYPYLKHNKPSK